jgi:tRNA A-37 threonylcarbamoyl transferase component Bud32
VTIRIRKIAPEEAPRREEWARALAEFDFGRAEVLKEDEGTGVYRTTMLGRTVVAKCWKLDSPARKAKSRLGVSRAFRHWRGAEWLKRHHIGTAQPLLLAWGRSPEGSVEWLIMHALEGRTLLELLVKSDLPVSQQHAIAKGLGEMTASMHLQGRWNRDSKPSNVICRLDHGQARLAVIDCVAIRRILPGDRPIVRQGAALVIEPLGVGAPVRRTLMARFLRGYLRAHHASKTAGLDPGYRDTTFPFTARKRSGRIIWRRIEAAVRSHGDPTPKVNPLPGGGRGALGEDLR